MGERPGAHAYAVSATAAVFAKPGTYRGYTFRNTSAVAVATVRVYDNASAASGTLLDTVQLAASESAGDWYADGGIRAENGVYVEVVAGAIEGSVRVG